MKLKGKNKFDTWLMNSDLSKMNKYMMVLFLTVGFYDIYLCYQEYHAELYYEAVISAWASGLLLTSGMYYIVIINFNRTNKNQTEFITVLIQDKFDYGTQCLKLQAENVKLRAMLDK